MALLSSAVNTLRRWSPPSSCSSIRPLLVVMSALSPPGAAVELQQLLAELDKSSPPSYPLASELLAFLAAQHIHAPKLVVKYGKQLILHHKGKLGDRGRIEKPKHRSQR